MPSSRRLKYPGILQCLVEDVDDDEKAHYLIFCLSGACHLVDHSGSRMSNIVSVGELT
jgi:hypothetical protein